VTTDQTTNTAPAGAPNPAASPAPEAAVPVIKTIAVIGGTGKEGSGLAARWAKAGYNVIIGSRDAARAQAKADEMNAENGMGTASGAENIDAAQRADLVVLTVPYNSHESTLAYLKDALQGKILVDVTVPLVPPKVRSVTLPAGKSASLEAAALLGPGVRVVTAYQNISNVHLSHGTDKIACDVLICGDDLPAKEAVINLTEALGMRGVDAGSLANSVAVESITPMLLYINRKYKIEAGILISGLPPHAAQDSGA
jgi:NADPH-dependent F420 reductase